MKTIFLIPVILLVFTGKLRSQDSLHTPRVADSTYSYFGVVYKDALRWIDTIRKPYLETNYSQRKMYSGTLLSEIPERFKMIAMETGPEAMKETEPGKQKIKYA